MLTIKPTVYTHRVYCTQTPDDDDQFRSNTHNQINKKVMRKFFEDQRIKFLEELRLAKEKLAHETRPEIKKLWINEVRIINENIASADFHIRQYSDT